MLFWLLPFARNPHLRQVNCGFSHCEQPQNSSCYTTLYVIEIVALLASALRSKSSFAPSMLRFLALRAASK